MPSAPSMNPRCSVRVRAARAKGGEQGKQVLVARMCRFRVRGAGAVVQKRVHVAGLQHLPEPIVEAPGPLGHVVRARAEEAEVVHRAPARQHQHALGA